jgi:steroid delta-isomerase
MTREERFIDFFSKLAPDNLSQIETVFAADARFKDPFNDVVGIEAIRTVFSHMFATTESPRFTIKHFASQDSYLFIHWDFNFIKNSKPWQIDGCSMVSFNQKNKVQQHIDYWDPAEQIYSKVSGLKMLMKFLVKQLKAT